MKKQKIVKLGWDIELHERLRIVAAKQGMEMATWIKKLAVFAIETLEDNPDATYTVIPSARSKRLPEPAMTADPVPNLDSHSECG